MSELNGTLSSDASAEFRLVERAQRGDRAAFGQLYQRHVDDVFAYVQLRVRNVAVAEDLTQDIFMNVFRALPRFRWQGSFAPWLLRCAHNRVANHWRAQGRRPDQVALPTEDDTERSMPELAGEADPIDAIDWRLSAEQIGGAMAALTELQQQVISLRFGAGLSLAETAEIMQRSQNAVKNLQHNALAALRRRLVPDELFG
jgi:RNA polymerase sigma-70 factor (ECF subfamily)